jgi:hypothetical protein
MCEAVSSKGYIKRRLLKIFLVNLCLSLTESVVHTVTITGV